MKLPETEMSLAEIPEENPWSAVHVWAAPRVMEFVTSVHVEFEPSAIQSPLVEDVCIKRPLLSPVGFESALGDAPM